MKATILALGLYRSSGGPSKSVKAFADALQGDVISWVDPRQLRRESLIWSNSTVIEGSAAPILRQLLVPAGGDIRAAEAIIRGSDVVSCHSFWRWHNIWLQKVAGRHRVPYWFVPHGALDPYVFEKQPLVKNAFLSLGGRRFLERAAAVVCATRREHEKLAHLMPATQAAIIPWPLAENDFRNQDPTVRSAVRRRLGIPQESVVLLLFGRLDPMKRPLETIALFAESAADDAHLLVVGEEWGVSRPQCEQMARKLNVADRVHVVGPAYGTDRTGYLDAADVYVSLSHRENYNFTATEAMASGLPVIISPGNDLGPDVSDVGCGWVLDSMQGAGDAITSASRMASHELAAMGRRGRTWAEANLRFEMFASRIQSLAVAIATRR